MESFRVGSATARVVCDSTYQGSRLTSVELEFPRPYLAEFNTHCRFSRNSASSRAIPVWKRLAAALEQPYVPNSFGANQPGMQAGSELSIIDRDRAVRNWVFGRNMAVIQSYALMGGRAAVMAAAGRTQQEAATRLCEQIENIVAEYGLGQSISILSDGLHKQHANRPLELYSFHTVIVTATHWRNFFGLRASRMAQPEAQDFALATARAMMASAPRELQVGEWHLPYIRPEDFDECNDQPRLACASAGKCARTSYLTQDGVRSLEKDWGLFESLKENGHMSPFQHPARPREKGDIEGSWGNYSPVWTQLRKTIPGEDDFTNFVSPAELLIGCRGDQAMVDFIMSLPE